MGSGDPEERGTGLAIGFSMNPILIPRTTMFAMLSFFTALASCNKPTSGSNNTEYREGGSGANTETIKKEGAGDAISSDPQKKD